MAAAPQEVLNNTANIDTETSEPVGHKNTVRQCVEEICNLMGDTHDLREEAMARGVQFHTLNVMIEMGLHNKPDEQAEMMKTALAASEKAHGSAAFTEEKLQSLVDNLVALEKDIGHVRRLAQLQDINLQAMNFLTQIIRLNPGDGGEKSVNDFIAYSALCGIKLEKFKKVADEIAGTKQSVLPDIQRIEEDKRQAARKQLISDILLGLAIGISVIWVFF